jgi:glucokinase
VSPLLLALDFGGTKHAAAVIAPGETQWRSHQRAVSPPQADAKSDLEVMRSLIRNLLNDTQPAAIGVSFGGPVDASSGTVRLSHHVPGWENLPLRQMLEAEFAAPVSVDNDANVAALGEHHFGAGQGYDSLLYITVSTGVGGGWILNRQLWRGAEGMAGEIGHMVIDPNGPVCLCGKRGCLERLASGPYIAQQVREQLQLQPHRGQILRAQVGGNLTTITAQQVSQAAAQGDDLAWEGLKKAGWALGVGIGNVANLINPQRFILGGGVMKIGENLPDMLREHLPGTLRDRFWEVVLQVARATALPEVHFEIVPAALGDDAPLWGAAALATLLHGSPATPSEG